MLLLHSSKLFKIEQHKESKQLSSSRSKLSGFFESRLSELMTLIFINSMPTHQSPYTIVKTIFTFEKTRDFVLETV